MVLMLFKNGFHLHPNAPKSVGIWGSAPDPPMARESAFGACQSDTSRERGANSHLRPGRQKPSVRQSNVSFFQDYIQILTTFNRPNFLNTT